MAENFNSDEGRHIPAGERIARLEVHVSAIRVDVADIRDKLEELAEDKTKQDTYAKIGRAVWGIFERVVLVLLGSAAAIWLQRYFGTP